MNRPVWAEVDLDAIAQNILTVKKWIGKDTNIMAVVKANAYGHGAIPVAATCLAHGVDSFAVSILAEGLELRQSGFQQPILIMGYTPPEGNQLLIENQLSQSIFSLEQAIALSQKAEQLGVKVAVHLKIDTGMGRVGFFAHQFTEILAVCQLPGLIVEGIFTHFAAADTTDSTYTKKQLSIFNQLINQLASEGIKPRHIHAANSAGIIQYPETHFNLVRAGLMLYGMYPSAEVKNQQLLQLKPAMTFKAKIAFIKNVKKGTSIGYGCTFTTERDGVIATLPLGYADGYSRHLSNCGKVLVNGKIAPVVGRVCMDQIMIDVTHLPEVKVGDEVILFGHDSKGTALPVEKIAQLAQTINYEIVCQVSYRVPRRYFASDSIMQHV